MKLLLVIIFFPFLAFSQSFEYGLIPNINQRGQLGNETCWAASLEMLASAYKKSGEKNDLQLRYIRKKSGDTSSCTSYKKCDPAIASKVDVLPIDSLLKELYQSYGKFNLALSANLKSKISPKDSIKYRELKDIETLTWADIKASFRGSHPSPLLLWREFGLNGYKNYHITTAIGYYEVKVNDASSTKFLLVNDSWVKSLDSVGTHYLVDFDQFMQTSSDEKAKIIMYGFDTPKGGQKIIPELSKTVINGSNTFSYKKKFLQRKTIAAKSLAKANVTKIIDKVFLKEKLLSEFFSDKLTDSTVVINAKNVTIIKDEEYDNFADFNKKLSNGEKLQYNVTATAKDTCFVYVTSKSKNEKKYTVVTQRIEPYKSSIIKVLDNIKERQTDTSQVVNAKPSAKPSISSGFAANTSGFKLPDYKIPADLLSYKFDNTFLYCSKNSKPDFLLIPNQSKFPSSYIIVDLFDKMKEQFKDPKIDSLPEIKGFANPIKLQNFNYKLYKLDLSSFNTLMAILKK